MSIFQNKWVESRVVLDEEGGDATGGEGDAGGGSEGGNEGGDSSGGDSNDGGDGAGASPGDAGGDPSWIQSTPDDWRSQIAGDDEAKLKKLERYTDLNTFLNSSFDAHNKIRTGELETGKPDGTDETALNDWREAQGIPLEAKYDISLPDEVVMTKDDQEILDAVMPIAHTADIPAATLSALTEGMIRARNAQVDQLLQQDGVESVQREQFLRDNWKGDYDANMQAVENLLTRELPEDMQEAFRQARGGDGKGIFNNPAVMMMFAKLERTIHPMSTIPGGGENATQTARDIVNKAKKLFKEDPDAYKDPAFQKQYDKAIEHLQSQGEKI